jgi:hypothetical protein
MNNRPANVTTSSSPLECPSWKRPWVVLLALGILAACSSSPAGSAGEDTFSAELTPMHFA